MLDKAKAIIVTKDGLTKTYEGDTIIAFVLNDVDKFLESESDGLSVHSAYAGTDFPEPVFTDLMAELIATLIKKKYKDNPLIASALIDTTAEILVEKVKELDEEIPNIKSDDFIKMMIDAINGIYKEGTDANGNADK